MDAASLLNDIAAVSDAPLIVMLEEIAGGKVQHGLPFKSELEKLPWGETVALTNQSEKKPQEQRFARLEISAAVQQAIAELKPKFRLPILLKYIEGLSYEEIASVMGCSKGTVASRLNRRHSQLAKRLAHLNNWAA